MTIGDDDDDKFEYGTNTYIIVTIVIIVTAGFGRGAGSPFQRAALAPRRAQNLLAGCIFDGSAVKSAFALLLTRVTEPRTVKF